jgi:hypothetical protein
MRAGSRLRRSLPLLLGGLFPVDAQLAIDFDAAAESSPDFESRCPRPVRRQSEARELGMQQSVDHADDVESGWRFQALAHLVAFAKSVGRPFLIEEARAYASAHGLPEPPTAKAWGAVTRLAVTKKRIEKAGAAPAASSNLSLKHTWTFVS